MTISAMDEFDFLPELAGMLGLGRDVLPIHRESVPSSYGAVSTVHWGTERPNLTFLHGAALNAHTWDTTLLSLRKPALVLDLPGHGDSDWREDADYRPGTSARTIAEVIDRVTGGQPQVVVGHSLGGMTAIALAAYRPDLVSKLILIDISPSLVPGKNRQVRDFLDGPPAFASRAEIVERALAHGLGASRESVERGVVFNTRVLDDGSVVFKHHLANLPPHAPALIEHPEESWVTLESGRFPTLLVYGSEGYLTDELVKEFVTRVPGAQALRLEAGHNVQQRAAGPLAEAIGTFSA
jgi:pimeloyl-ACP methyl ester carboxylesterase